MANSNLVFIDDDSAVLSAYQRMLRHTEYQCRFEQDAQYLLAQADLTNVQVLLVDQRMPGINGSELLAALNGQYPEMKRVLLSGDTAAAKLALAAGVQVDAVLSKPCSKQTLLACIEQLVKCD